MQEVEKLALEKNRSLLVLDTKLGDAAEQLYHNMGYIRVGEIPDFAADSGGRFNTTVIFYKILKSL